MKKSFLIIACLLILGFFIISCSDNGSDENRNAVDQSAAGIWWGDFDTVVPFGEWSSYEWNFGDGTPSIVDEEEPVHKYDNPGIYAATLTFKDDAGKTGNGFVLITVGEAGPTAEIGVVDDLGEEVEVFIFDVGEPINFVGRGLDASGTVVPCGEWDVYEWNFGDGSTSTDENPPHPYEKAGNYTVMLKVIDDNGVTGSAALSIMVGYTAPVANINEPASGLTFETGEEVNFKGKGFYQNFIIGIVSEDGTARFIGDEGRQYNGTLDVDGWSVSGNIDLINWNVDGDDYSSTAEEITGFNGGVLLNTWLLGTYVEGNNDGAFNLWYMGTYGDEHDIADLSGEWVLKDAFDAGNSLTISISDTGAVTAEDERLPKNEFVDGTISLYDNPEDDEIYNVFEVSLSFHGEELTGLATYLNKDSILTDEDVLVFGLTSNSYSLSGFAVRGE